jgi:hypothetical protein
VVCFSTIHESRAIPQGYIRTCSHLTRCRLLQNKRWKRPSLNPIAILSKLKKQIPETLSTAWDYCNIWSAMPTADQSTVHSEHPDVVLVCWQRQEDPSFCWNYVQLRFFYGTNVLMLFSYPKLWTMYIYSEKILDQLTNVKGA